MASDTTATGHRPQYAAASVASIHASPGTAVLTSEAVGWAALHLHVREKRGAAAHQTSPYESLATPDQTLVVTLAGEYEIERFANGAWRRAVRQGGSGGLTPAGDVDRLRWRSRGPAVMRSAYVYLPGAALHEAEEHFRRAGAPGRAAALVALGFRDPAVVYAVQALIQGVATGAPEVYAEAAAQYLATHLLALHGAPAGGPDDRRAPGALTDRRLARALEYMSAHYGEPLTLARIAAEAGVSKFHFGRLFRAATGETPHAHLVRLRMRAARQLLRDTDLTAAEVAAATGYASATHFGRAFTHHTGRTPLAFRRAGRGA